MGVEAQDSGEIAWAWIANPKVYPGIPMPKWWCSCWRGQWWLQAAVLLKFWVFVDNTYQADQMGSCGLAAGFGKLSTKNTTNLRNHQIYLNWNTKILWYYRFHVCFKSKWCYTYQSTDGSQCESLVKCIYTYQSSSGSQSKSLVKCSYTHQSPDSNPSESLVRWHSQTDSNVKCSYTHQSPGGSSSESIVRWHNQTDSIVKFSYIHQVADKVNHLVAVQVSHL